MRARRSGRWFDAFRISLTVATALALAGACERSLDGAPCSCSGGSCECAGGFQCCPDRLCRRACEATGGASTTAPVAGQTSSEQAAGGSGGTKGEQNTAEAICEASESESNDGQWCWWNPQPHGRQLLAIWGQRDDDIWVGGEAGTLLRWDGGGWKEEAGSPARLAISQIWGATADDLWAVAGSQLLHRLDGHWSTYDLAERIYRLWGSAPDDVWAVQADGLAHWDGTSWSAADFPFQAPDLRAIWGSGNHDVWVVGNRVFHFDGSHWEESPADSSLCGDIQIPWNQIRGTSADDFWMARYDGSCLFHWDGRRWSRAEDADFKLRRLFEIQDTAEIGGMDEQGSIVRWDGIEWSLVSTYPGDSAIAVNALWADAAGELWTVGNGAAITRWSNGGWTEDSVFPAITREDLQHVHGISRTKVWSVGRGGMILAYDGQSWTEEASLTKEDLNGVWARDHDDVWAVGEHGTIVHRDAEKWSIVASTRAELTAVWASAVDDAWSVGMNGAIFHFNGAIWTPFESPTPDNLLAIWGTSDKDIWVVGGRLDDDGTKMSEEAEMFHWNASGWTSYGVTSSAEDVDTAGDPSAWWTCAKLDRYAPPLGAVGIWGNGSSDVWVTTRCSGTLHFDGTAWDRPGETLNDHDIRGIWSSRGSAWAVGNWGTIKRWNGANWSDTFPSESVTPRINAIWGADPSEIWAVGASGTILRNRSLRAAEP